MDGPLISTQQTVVENDFNAKQRPERQHLTVGNLEFDVIPSKLGRCFQQSLTGIIESYGLGIRRKIIQNFDKMNYIQENGLSMEEFQIYFF